ncbi:hypothetical protein SLA2020_158590 [Shorea laevis]
MAIVFLPNLFSHLKYCLFFMVSHLLCFISQLLLPNIFQEPSSIIELHEEERPSAALVPVPYTSFIALNMIKETLPVIEFRKYSRLQQGAVGDHDCAICLGSINGSEEIRELVNCNHVYHKECLDRWMDEGNNVTCPLCRLKLLPDDETYDHDGKDEKDPWRMERIAYLFGEDCLFHSF